MKCVQPEVIMMAKDFLGSKVAKSFAQVWAEATLVIMLQVRAEVSSVWAERRR